jgi:hypothetical protein
MMLGRRQAETAEVAGDVLDRPQPPRFTGQRHLIDFADRGVVDGNVAEQIGEPGRAFDVFADEAFRQLVLVRLLRQMRFVPAQVLLTDIGGVEVTRSRPARTSARCRAPNGTAGSSAASRGS